MPNEHSMGSLPNESNYHLPADALILVDDSKDLLQRFSRWPLSVL